MYEVYVLTFEYSDHSGFYICGATDRVAEARIWIAGGENNHVYKIPLNQVMATHPRSEGWKEWRME